MIKQAKKKKPIKKSRFLYLHQETNKEKVIALNDLQVVYTDYLQICKDAMLAARRLNIPLSEMQKVFPPTDTLSSQIVKNARGHLVDIVSGWAASNYATKLKFLITEKFKAKEFDEAAKIALYSIGKHLIDKATEKYPQKLIDLYWSWLLDEAIVGKTPTISDRCGMRMSEMTSTLANSEKTRLTTWWIGVSHLKVGEPRIQLPLVPSPYAKSVNDVSKGVLARVHRGRWRFEVVDKKDWETPVAKPEMPRIGIDVGLNVVVATSNGDLFGGKKDK